MSNDIVGDINSGVNWKKIGFLLLGMGLFAVVYWSPSWPDGSWGGRWQLSRRVARPGFSAGRPRGRCRGGES